MFHVERRRFPSGRAEGHHRRMDSIQTVVRLNLPHCSPVKPGTAARGADRADCEFPG